MSRDILMIIPKKYAHERWFRNKLYFRHSPHHIPCYARNGSFSPGFAGTISALFLRYPSDYGGQSSAFASATRSCWSFYLLSPKLCPEVCHRPDISMMYEHSAQMTTKI